MCFVTILGHCIRNVLFVVTVGNRMGQQLGEHQILCAPDDA